MKLGLRQSISDLRLNDICTHGSCAPIRLPQTL